jgi:hypothetical protein
LVGARRVAGRWSDRPQAIDPSQSNDVGMSRHKPSPRVATNRQRVHVTNESKAIPTRQRDQSQSERWEERSGQGAESYAPDTAGAERSEGIG